jgi:hypothetical protein
MYLDSAQVHRYIMGVKGNDPHKTKGSKLLLPFALLGWPVIVSIQPFADIVSCDTCHDGDYEGNEIFHTFHPFLEGSVICRLFRYIGLTE